VDARLHVDTAIEPRRSRDETEFYRPRLTVRPPGSTPEGRTEHHDATSSIHFRIIPVPPDLPADHGGAEDGPESAVRTDSSAMDVAAPSNLARLEWLSARTDTRLSDLVNPTSIGVEEARDAQRWAFRRHSVMIDPHTATGVARARRMIRDHPGARPLVVETAHPGKFPTVVPEVLGRPAPEAEWLQRSGEEHWVEIDADPEALVAILDEGLGR